MNQLSTNFKTTKTFWVIIGLVFLSMILREVPVLNLIFAPFNQLQVLLHEMSHALACVMTGGWVSGLTIVDDGKSHAGLTFTHGGIPFIYAQAGYIGETIWGCLLIALSRFSKLSRYILMGLGVLMAVVSLNFMTAGIFNPAIILQEIGSLVWGLALSAGLFYVGLKLSNRWAHLLLLFLAVQSCLSSLDGVWVLFLQSMGAFPGVWSDATNMEKMTGIPAAFWGVSWAAFSIGMLTWVMWLTFKADRKTAPETAAIGSAKESKAITGQAAGNKQIENKLSVEQELMELRQTVDNGQKIKINKEEKRS